MNTPRSQITEARFLAPDVKLFRITAPRIAKRQKAGQFVIQIKPLTVSFINGWPVFSWLPVISTVVSCVIFITVAIWRFNRQEF